MDDNQTANILRILGQAVTDIANVFDDATTDDLNDPALTNLAPAIISMPTWAKRRKAYLKAYAGGPLTLEQVRKAAKDARYGNPGPATSQGYVEIAGSHGELRAITAKGKDWLAEWDGKA